jgi:hypothetical protein
MSGRTVLRCVLRSAAAKQQAHQHTDGQCGTGDLPRFVVGVGVGGGCRFAGLLGGELALLGREFACDGQLGVDALAQRLDAASRFWDALIGIFPP